jgi:FMN phosphatase YigB (HAD superfamily)
MSLDFIEFLRTKEVYKYFDGEVVSCHEKVVKPDVEIYKILVDRYNLNPAETLFIDDRKCNVAAAIKEGWQGFDFDAHNPEQSCIELRQLLLNKDN